MEVEVELGREREVERKHVDMVKDKCDRMARVVEVGERDARLVGSLT